MRSLEEIDCLEEIFWVEGPEGDIARRLAVEGLYEVLKKNKNSDEVVNFFITKYKLKDNIRSFFTNLLYGTLRYMGTIDHIIEICSEKGFKKADPLVSIIMRLGAFQILYLTNVPAYAAVDESVELAKTLNRSWSAGYVNAVLRRIAREKDFISFVPFQKDPVEHIALSHSFTRWMAEKLISQYGDVEAHEIAKSLNKISPLTIRVNTLKKSPEAVFHLLSKKYKEVERGHYLKEAIRLKKVSSIDLKFYLKPGNFHIQDEGSMLMSLFLKAEPKMRVLDMCSAPGGKISHIAELTGNSAELWACDVNEKKLKKMKRHLDEMEVKVKNYIIGDLTKPHPSLKENYFERVLLDAPCTGSGTIRRNPELKWRITRDSLLKLQETQYLLLKNGFRYLKRGGLLLYVTCSIFKEENEDVIKRFLNEMKQECEIIKPSTGISSLDEKLEEFISEDKYIKLLPHKSMTDGFFAALLRKK